MTNDVYDLLAPDRVLAIVRYREGAHTLDALRVLSAGGAHLVGRTAPADPPALRHLPLQAAQARATSNPEGGAQADLPTTGGRRGHPPRTGCAKASSRTVPGVPGPSTREGSAASRPDKWP